MRGGAIMSEVAKNNASATARNQENQTQMETTAKNIILGFTTASFCVLAPLLIFSHAAFAGPYEDAINAKVRQDYTTAYNLFSPLANSGNAEAQFEIALLYLNGHYGANSQQKSTGVTWLRRAANGGHLQAQKEMHVLFIIGSSYGVSDEESVKYVRMAAEQGDASSEYSMGLSYKHRENYSKARFWFEKAAAQGYDAALIALKELPTSTELASSMYSKNSNTNKQFTFQDANDAINRGDEISAFKIYKTLADKGNVDASYWTGYAFEYARGTVQSYGDSIKYYTIAAEKGSKEAQSKLGVIYLNGTVVTQNKNTAIFWLKKAQAQGDIIAKLKLSELKIPYTVPVHSDRDDIKKFGTRNQRSKSETDLSIALKSYKNAKQKVASEAGNLQALKQKLAGLRKKRDDAEKTLKASNKLLYLIAISEFQNGRIEKAVSTMQKLANEGHFKSQVTVSLIFMGGTSIKQDITKSSFYLTEASNNDYTNNFLTEEKMVLAEAQAALARVFEKGDGVTKNDEKSFLWIKKAAQNDLLSAMVILALDFELGVGTARSTKKAIYWYKKAAERGNESAKKQLERLGQ